MKRVCTQDVEKYATVVKSAMSCDSTGFEELKFSPSLLLKCKNEKSTEHKSCVKKN